jgi:Family of unknown function (DUF6084)
VSARIGSAAADELTIAVTGAAVEPHAAVPTTSFSAPATATAPVHSIALRTQIMIEPQRRRYDASEEERLLELFGDIPQWGDSLRPFLWTHVDKMVAGFDGSGVFELPVTCTYDFEVAGAKYLHALGSGEVPLLFLFSGTTFCRGPAGFAASMVPWHLESRFRLPVATWRETMDRYFPNAGWIRASRDTIDRLQRFRVSRALPTPEQAIDTLLKEAGER